MKALELRVIDSKADVDVEVCEEIREGQSEVWEEGWVVGENELFGSVGIL